MIDLTQIEIELGYGPDDETVFVTRGEVLELIARLRQAEKDAARYRWLRDESWGCDKDIVAPKVMYGRMNQKVMLAENAMDAAIDEAMNASNN